MKTNTSARIATPSRRKSGRFTAPVISAAADGWRAMLSAAAAANAAAKDRNGNGDGDDVDDDIDISDESLDGIERGDRLKRGSADARAEFGLKRPPAT